MTISITEVRTRPDLKKWVTFPLGLYRGDPNFYPQLTRDELDFFPEKNPSFKIADTKLVLPHETGTWSGGCAASSTRSRRRNWVSPGRFGWFECVDDAEVAAALLGYLEGWFAREGCREMTGPHGFSDLDPEGMLVEGFEALPTIAGSYNKPYYRSLVEGFGFEKEVDYIEQRVEVPQEPPALFKMMEKKVLPAAEAEGYRLVKDLTKKRLQGYVGQFWEVLEAAFEALYGVTPLTGEQKAYYAKKYFGYIDPRFVQMVMDRQDRLQGFFLGLPSLSRAFQKANGRLWPLGFFHILKGFRQYDTVDFYLPASARQPQRILPLMILGMYRSVREKNVRYIETNRELETNTMIVNTWSRFNVVSKRRTRIFRKSSAGRRSQVRLRTGSRSGSSTPPVSLRQRAEGAGPTVPRFPGGRRRASSGQETGWKITQPVPPGYDADGVLCGPGSSTLIPGQPLPAGARQHVVAVVPIDGETLWSCW
jgi:hypothetical protein